MSDPEDTPAQTTEKDAPAQITQEAPPVPTKILTREEILDADDVEISDPIPVPQWGGCVYVRVIDGKERDDVEANFARLTHQAEVKKKPMDVRGQRVDILRRTICDSKGNRIFTTADLEALNKKNSKALDTIADFALDFNKMDEKALDAAEKNSKGERSDSSGSDSPKSSENQ